MSESSEGQNPLDFDLCIRIPAASYEHARDIPDDMFMAAVRQACAESGRTAASRWDVEAVLGNKPVPRDFMAHPEIPGVPSKVVLAKARRLIKRGKLSGCDCGCRGDFMAVDA